MLPLLTFRPIFKERVWGGRRLEELYHKPLPPRVPIGESWEVSDRPGDESVVPTGPLAGRSLRWLMENHTKDLLGDATTQGGRFPLLVKLLDSREKLSLQVHPPETKALGLGGEPKTEMWYIAAAAPNAELYVGLKRGVTRAEFERKIRSGEVAGCFHRIPVQAGDSMFLPSGRVHAIGEGLVIFEIQQNSDTTYRVFDWNRVGLDGKPRDLHVAESLESIHFDDFEPGLISAEAAGNEHIRLRALVTWDLFQVTHVAATGDVGVSLTPGRTQIVAVLHGQVEVRAGGEHVTRAPGEFCLVPACVEADVRAQPNSSFLWIQVLSGRSGRPANPA